jgi:hypothetical protein
MHHRQIVEACTGFPLMHGTNLAASDKLNSFSFFMSIMIYPLFDRSNNGIIFSWKGGGAKVSRGVRGVFCSSRRVFCSSRRVSLELLASKTHYRGFSESLKLVSLRGDQVRHDVDPSADPTTVLLRIPTIISLFTAEVDCSMFSVRMDFLRGTAQTCEL